MQVKSFFTKTLTTFACVEYSLVAKVKMVFVSSVRASNRAPPKPHPRRECGLCCVGPALPVPQLLEHETKAKCNKAKVAPASTSGTLGPYTPVHVLGVVIDVDGPADAATTTHTTTLAVVLDAALAATATLYGEEPHSTAYSSGDCAIAIEWYERVEGGLDRRAFISADGVVYLANSTEFRRIVALGGVTEQQSHGNGGSGGDDGDEPTFVLERQERGGLGPEVVQVSGASPTHWNRGEARGGGGGLLPPLAPTNKRHSGNVLQVLT